MLIGNHPHWPRNIKGQFGPMVAENGRLRQVSRGFLVEQRATSELGFCRYCLKAVCWRKWLDREPNFPEKVTSTILLSKYPGYDGLCQRKGDWKPAMVSLPLPRNSRSLRICRCRLKLTSGGDLRWLFTLSILFYIFRNVFSVSFPNINRVLISIWLLYRIIFDLKMHPPDTACAEKANVITHI